MGTIKAFLKWYWEFAVYFGVMAILVSLGLFVTGGWLTIMTASTLPMTVTTTIIVGILLLQILIMIVSIIVNIWNIRPKRKKGRH